MRTTLDCLPCLLKQALYAARLATEDQSVQKEIMGKVAQLLSELDLALSPPENAVGIYSLIAREAGCEDPFRQLKKKSNDLALSLRTELQQQVSCSEEPLLTALRFAIAGNIIDYGANHEFDVPHAIASCLKKALAIDHFREFAEDVKRAETILYLADNCGELVFDGIVIEQLGKPVTLAVKEGPVINDATVADARACGMDKYCRVISNGTNCPGTPLKSCSSEFREIFQKADLIISKGQGNFETLSESKAPLYFLLTVKCPVVARHISDYQQPGQKAINVEDMIIMKNHDVNAKT